MDVDTILGAMNNRKVDNLLIGGMNFLLRHAPVLTYDVDLWIDDTPENRRRTEEALADLQAEWGMSESEWGPVATRRHGWLECQPVFCLASPSGAIDIFRHVAGLDVWRESKAEAILGRTALGTPYWAISDRDMLRCQMALPESERKSERVCVLNKLLGGTIAE